jgi:hypothetical protein
MGERVKVPFEAPGAPSRVDSGAPQGSLSIQTGG